jgi:BASS family bile acid:Na+ symporter
MTAQHLFNSIFNASLAVMITTLVAGLGMSLTVRQIVAPLRKAGVLATTVVANTILAPFIAIGICNLFPLASEARIGVELATMAAAGPVGMKVAQFTKRADMATALSFTIVLQLLNIVAAPLWAHHIVTGATVNRWTIVKDLLLMVLAPLVIGIVLRARHPEHADGWRAGLEKASNIALLTAIAIGLAVNWSLVVHALGTWVVLASAVIV